MWFEHIYDPSKGERVSTASIRGTTTAQHNEVFHYTAYFPEKIVTAFYSILEALSTGIHYSIPKCAIK